ncbi:cell cycle control protein [Aspergillus rambellii]|uniref:Cell cycle control protein n=1 Tax=Aspergillus rambellii TaxID=308745 RepID=A0A0F8WJ49_9EURO|nr:cell cycle control protein [Aspergillus rambellii]
MPSDDDLKTHAASNHDFYALLDISPAASEAEIRRAYRRTALKYHPDKITNPTQEDIDKFHLLQIANDVLSDPAVRQLYDNAREARERKKRDRDMMDAAKRKMREDLEARERAGAAGGAQRGMKRSWAAAGMAGGYDDDAEEKLQREIERIAEDGRRRRREAEDRLKQEIVEDEKRLREEEEAAQRAADRSSQRVDRAHEGGTNIPEQERAVKVRWIREGRGLNIDKDRLISLFAPFGKIDNVLVLKDRRQRLGEKKEKTTVASGVVVFASIVSAHAAVLDSEKIRRASIGQTDNDWNAIDSVFWALGNQPDLGAGVDSRSGSPSPGQAAGAPPSTKEDSAPKSTPKPTFSFSGLKSAGAAGGQPGKAPSFGSFSSAATGGASKPGPPGDSTNGAKTPSLQEMTFMRLKSAQREKERKALEEQLRKEDEAADVAEAATTKG